MSLASKSSKSRDSNIAEAAILDLKVDKTLGTGLLKPMMQCSEKGARFLQPGRNLKCKES